MQSTIVEATAKGADPASSTKSTSSIRRSSSVAPEIAASAPCVFALVIANGHDSLRASARTTLEFGKRRAIVLLSA